MIGTFTGEHRWLSNFHEAPIKFNGQTFRTTEGAYQSMKFIECMDIAPWQFEQLSGRDAKKLANQKKAFVRENWQEISLPTMCEVTHAKYTQHKDLRIMLVNTFPHDLVEGNNWHDMFYGVCSCKGPGMCFKPGPGKNWLGRILQAERIYWLDLMSQKSWEKQGAALVAV